MKFFHILLVAWLLAGAERALGIEGSLYTWGRNYASQLGNGNTNDTYQPILISVSGKTWASISLGSVHSGGITSDGSLYMWGQNTGGQLGLGNMDTMSIPYLVSAVTTTWKALALGLQYTGAITTGGALYMWGYNGYGQLGTSNATMTYSTVPILISVDGITWAALALGERHTGALTTSGMLYMWGNNNYGQLGNGTNSSSLEPIPISVAGLPCASLALSSSHTGAITTSGALYMWGWNLYGQLGNGNNNNSYVPFLISVAGKLWAALSLGSGFSGALSTDGGLYMWGYNYYGQLGNGGNTDSSVPVPISLGGSMVAAVSLGNEFAAAKTMDGALYLWGSNMYGQLGKGDTAWANSPLLLPMRSKSWATVVAGADHCGAITNYTIPSPSPTSSSMSPSLSPTVSPSTSTSISMGPSTSSQASPSPARSPNPSPQQSPNPSPSPSPTTKQNSTASPSPSSGVVHHYTILTIIVAISLWAMALM